MQDPSAPSTRSIDIPPRPSSNVDRSDAGTTPPTRASFPGSPGSMSHQLPPPPKVVLVTGGVLSGLGKGIIASSTGRLLRSRGHRVTSIKIDPYLNIDAGTMSPFEHGEVFVLDDGGEVDLDLGNYERFLGVTLGRDNNLTTGKVYQHVIQRERQGKYLGKTVQVVPHVCDAIQDWIERVSRIPVDGQQGQPDVCVIELGGTVGDIESMPFIEAMRQFQFRIGKANFCSIHVSLVPVLGPVGEQKTKPTQHSVREVRALGLSPDVVVCRSERPLQQVTKSKIASFCHVAPHNVIGVHNVSNIYQVPEMLRNQRVDDLIMERLHLKDMRDSVGLDGLAPWIAMAERYDLLRREAAPVHIALVGKYTGLSDSYLSVIKALNHAAYVVDRAIHIEWVEASHLEDEHKESNEGEWKAAWRAVRSSDGVLVPGGFGDRGVAGKMLAAEHARTSKKPYLGICLGMQLAVVEFCRNVLHIEGAESAEFVPHTEEPVVIFMPEGSKTHMGGTMRLGQRETTIVPKWRNVSITRRLYGGSDVIVERHRHRYEVNPEYVQRVEEAGMMFVGVDDTGELPRNEIVELCRDMHPFYIGCQFHPEFKSRPDAASPPFVGLLLAASGQLEDWLQEQEQ